MSIRTLLATLLLLGCAACGGPQAPDPERGQAERDERAYLRPPAILTAQSGLDGVFRVEGVAQPNARISLAGIGGGAMRTSSDPEGHWSLTIPAAQSVRLFQVTMAAGARSLDGEGYLMLAPDGRSALLRSGSASQVLAAPSRGPRILAVDFDRNGGAIIGGLAPVGSGMNIRVDHTGAGDVVANAEGRFVAAIREPLRSGPHLIDISGDAGGDQIVVRIDPPAPLAGAPFRATRLDSAWRIDWVTPGGGLQSSIVVARTETGA